MNMHQQDKRKEIQFFDELAESQEYNVFTDEGNNKIIDTVVSVLDLQPGARILDVGCGSGIFTELMQERGYELIGIDLSHALLNLGKKNLKSINFTQGDAESMPFADSSFDAVMFSCLLHHLPDPSLCIQEARRVLKPKGRFVGFDPNRLNPFMYLYRDRSSPFYSNKGVTENERPVLPGRIRKIFDTQGFHVQSKFISGLSYRYVESGLMRKILPIYNFIDKVAFMPSWMKQFRAFVFTHGYKIPS